MRGRIAAAFIFAAAISPATASRMSAGGKGAQGTCRVVAGEKLLAKAGGSAALCAEVQRAITVAAPKARYSVEIEVLPRSRLSASLVVNGRALSEQKFAVMDGDLRPASIRRFAQGLATEVASAVKQ